MKHRGAHLPVQGGWRRGVYTKSRMFRMQDKKRELRSCGFSSRKKTDNNSFILAASRGYLITLSARSTKSAGIVTAISFAVFKLITSSNFVGCSTGKSAGLAPFRILSTYVATRR